MLQVLAQMPKSVNQSEAAVLPVVTPALLEHLLVCLVTYALWYLFSFETENRVAHGSSDFCVAKALPLPPMFWDF